MSFKQRTIMKVIVALASLMVFLIGGLKEQGWALPSEVPLQVEENRLTGHLSQVTLRSVLEQLQEQIGLSYEAPREELEKTISIDLQQVPLLSALATILAPWDYAFTVNSAGDLQVLYVTSKAPPTDIVPEPYEPSEAQFPEPVAETDLSPQDDFGGGNESADLSLSSDPDAQSSPSTSSPDDSFGDSAQSAGVPMPIQPVPEGTTMPMVPSSGGGGMNVAPAANPPDMPIIPATAYPPMEIQPVPDYLKQEMLGDMQR